MTSIKEHLGEDNNAPKRKHRATYARDNRKGGWMVRVAGEYPEKFAGRRIPITMLDGDEHVEELDKLIWSGTDKKSGELVALYTFKQQPRGAEELPF